jgi:hypothetical protein
VAEVRSNDMVQSAEAQGSELDTLDSPSESGVKPERIVGGVVLRAQCGDHANAPIADPAQCKRDRLRRRTIEPLQVVDREHERRGKRKQAQRRQHGHRDGTRAWQCSARACAQQRDIERRSLRLR